MKRTLPNQLIRHVINTPEKRALTIISDEDHAEIHLTYKDFYRQAYEAARSLEIMGIQKNDLVLIVLKHSPLLLTSFWGTMLMGGQPSIFPYLTEKLDSALYRERIKLLVQHEKIKVVITFSEHYAELNDLLQPIGCKVLNSNEIDSQVFGLEEDVQYDENADENDIAFLQHSSGTTGLQKGVALSHSAVFNQLDSYSKRLILSPDDVIINWLPLYHDMGLIAGFILPIMMGIPLVIMSPFFWVKSPITFLELIPKYKATFAWLPNFAFNHFVRGIRASEIEGLDLSTIRSFINCSEPAIMETHNDFADKFKPAGFTPGKISVSYAMAENTFAVTQTEIGKSPYVDWVNFQSLSEEKYAAPSQANINGAFPVVSCGKPIENCKVNVINEKGDRLGEREVGEIIVSSNSMLTEYYNRPKITREAFVDGWYRTEDIGYIANQEVFITGRKKDIIIVGGKNVFPQDLEAIANTIDEIYPGRAAAFGVFDQKLGTESIIMVAELKHECKADEQKAIKLKLRKKIMERTEVTLRDLQFVDRKWIIKTSSGKIARSENRKKYLKEFSKGNK